MDVILMDTQKSVMTKGVKAMEMIEIEIKPETREQCNN
jgi:hypothetical protein